MKSIYEFSVETALKHKRKRKIIVCGMKEEIRYHLLRQGIFERDLIIFPEDELSVLEKFQGKSQSFYIIVGKQIRNEENKKILERLGYREIHDYIFIHGMHRFITQEMYVNVKETGSMNIMGATSFERMPLLLPHFQMLQDTNPGKLIHYYLFYHASMHPETEAGFRRLARYAKAYENIDLHGIPVGNEDKELRDLMENYIGIDRMHTISVHGAFYYKLLMHKYLPKSLDRILYMDVGDTVINASLAPFYYEDFDGKAMLVTIGNNSRKRDEKGILVPFSTRDCENKDCLYKIGREIFNGGMHLINLEKWRTLDYNIHDYLEYAKKIQDKYHLGAGLFYDQGLLGFLFLEDMKYYKMLEMNDDWFMPFNYVVYRFLGENANLIDTYYEPAVLHFCGNSVRPWQVKYPQKLKLYQDGIVPRKGNGNAELYYFQWYEAARKAEEIIEECDRKFELDNPWDIRSIRTLDEYLDCLSFLARKYLVAISIRDTAGYGFSNRMAEKLTRLGLVDMRMEARWSYIFLRNKDEILLNKLNGFETAIEDRLILGTHEIRMSSMPFTKGWSAKIIVDGRDYAVNCRGLNIVVLDLDCGILVDSVGFDTFLPDNPCYRKPDLYYLIHSYSLHQNDFCNFLEVFHGKTYQEVVEEVSKILRNEQP